MKQMKIRIDKNKVYNFIGRIVVKGIFTSILAVVYASIIVLSVMR